MNKKTLKAKTQFAVAILAIVAAFIMCATAQADMNMPGMDHGSGHGSGHSSGHGSGMPMPQTGMPKGSPAPVDPTCPMPFPAQNLCAAVVFATPATVGKESVFQIEFHNHTTGTPEDPVGDVGVFLWMEMMGHGSSPVAIAHTNGSGVYLVTKAFFVMRGPWDIHVTVKTPELNVEAITTVDL